VLCDPGWGKVWEALGGTATDPREAAALEPWFNAELRERINCIRKRHPYGYPVKGRITAHDPSMYLVQSMVALDNMTRGAKAWQRHASKGQAPAQEQPAQGAEGTPCTRHDTPPLRCPCDGHVG
jgi:hypothetical protein